ncbi:DUF3284 domain-containing protein [Enterococcus casseliflavus]|uniref:DUF3284 domain-containing protein n=1 Tax=unclassified Enterococcus TaxID=2608891 RepID=UPI000B3E7B2F|nr:DUF3284 domain-containing protein [Enterococcus sp. 8E11_MSG4843]MBF0013773.1 DUF3284 domain-containing protein [Enterococcus casseliflavus]MBO1096618.1 DUF3284 domain-containing protein [Enterococcus casseliflavus]MBO1144941.1 DUF3284 domain-containing protein [Enterococcus casseliflavus]OUZ36915.1 hypothetical protein A5885_001105 [Enterococcus sp. 8E11_MSG4843]
MRIEKDLSIPANVFYDQIMDSVIFDIRKATGKTLSRKQLAGFQYVKEFSTMSRAKIEIEEIIENQVYQFKTETTKNEFVARYEVTPLDGKSSKVIYTETMKSHGFMQQLNDMLLGTILGYFKRKQFKKMLSMMEEAY